MNDTDGISKHCSRGVRGNGSSHENGISQIPWDSHWMGIGFE